jgi:alpha-glucosidase
MTHPAWTQGVHHDGSVVYVSNPQPTLNESVEIRLRVPKETPITHIFLRTAPDGEQAYTQMHHDHDDAVSAWYTAPMSMRNRLMTYRFRLMTADGALIYNAHGISRATTPDHADFKLLADFESPAWLDETVFYQIFPDRFYNGDPSLTPKADQPFHHPPYPPFETTIQDWDTPPQPFEQAGTVDFYGGDIPGIIKKLAYLGDLGVNALYLNPIFTSSTNHKYNIDDFYNVDPAFGGNDALANLRKALDKANMYYVLDLTPNHTGHKNPWFLEAQADPNAETADFFTFYDHPQDYECWLGVKTLPKLNYHSNTLRQRMYAAPDAVMRRWLQAPYRADGWRLDVWNMTARQGGIDVQPQVGRGMRQAVKATNPQAYLFGEHFFDASGTLHGDSMDASMNYQGFTFPVWRWLAGYDLGAWQKNPANHVDRVPIDADTLAQQMTNFMAAIPWAVARLQFNQLSSHDVPRILSVVQENKPLAKLAAALLLTYPGVPCIYYGDEIAMTGGREPANRAGMFWDVTRQDQDMRQHYQQLITLRRTHSALTQGGFQFLQAVGGLLAFQRTSPGQRLIFVGYRGDARAEDTRLPVWHGGIADGTRFTDYLSGASYTVEDGALQLGNLAEGATLILLG